MKKTALALMLGGVLLAGAGTATAHKAGSTHRSRGSILSGILQNKTEAHFFELPFSPYYFQKLQNLFWQE